MNFQIAVDGPSATGKSTLAKMLAKHFNMLYIDTGAMYRSLAYLASNHGINDDDEDALVKLFDDFSIEFIGSKVFCNGIDISNDIREERIGIYTSKIAKLEQVRSALVTYQQELAAAHDCIMDGRDIGTVVLPDAALKIYLDASVESRANRRLKELISKGITSDYETVYKDIETRDYEDMNRKISPLKQASDAVYVDSSEMTIEEEFNYLCNLIETKRKEVYR